MKVRIGVSLGGAGEPGRFGAAVDALEAAGVDSLWLPENVYSLTKSPAECPDEPAYVDLAFERGAPVSINGVPMPLVELIAILGTIAGAHGVGRIDVVKSHVAGVTPREVREAPAAVVLHAAHRQLRRLVTAKDLARFHRSVSLQYSDIICDGRWFTPMRGALDAFGEISGRIDHERVLDELFAEFCIGK